MAGAIIIFAFVSLLKKDGASQSSMRDVTTKISRQRSKCSKITMNVKQSDMKFAFKVTFMTNYKMASWCCVNSTLSEMKRNTVLPELVLFVFIRSAF